MTTFTYKQGVDGYSGTSDTMLRESRSGKSYSSTSNINVDASDGAGLQNQGLLYLSDIFGNGLNQIPAGATITSAILTLDVNNGTGDPVKMYRMLDDWATQSVWTWDSFGDGIQTDGTEAASQADVALSGLSSGTQTIDVTSSLQAWANGGANHGWVFKVDGSDGLDFDSSEGLFAPALDVTWEIVGPPTPGLTVVESDGSTFVAEGIAGDTFDLVLDAAPVADVTVTIGNNADIAADPATVVFTAANWNVAQTVTLSAVDDELVEDPELLSIDLTVSSTDNGYDGLSETLDVTVYDNDTATSSGPVTVVFQQGLNGYFGTSDTMLREKNPSKSYASASSVNIDGSDSSGKLNEGLIHFADIFGPDSGKIPIGASISSATLTLEVTDSTPQAFSVNRMLMDWVSLPTWTWNSLGNGIQTNGTEASATADAMPLGIGLGSRDIDVTQSLQAWADGEVNYGWAVLMGGSNGWEFDTSEGAIAPKLTVNWELLGPPIPGLSISEGVGSTFVSEGGVSDSFDVKLTTAPSADVTVTLAGNADINVSPLSLTFTTADWDVAQSVSLTAVDDALDEGTEVFDINLSTSSADPLFDNLNTIVDVTVYDNDATPIPPPGPVVVAVHDTTQYTLGDPSGFGSSDPSGLAYVPGMDLLFIADSEHNESPFFSTTNLFAVRPDGTHVASYSLTAFCNEPTGLAYNPDNGYLYITDDDADKVFWIDPANPEVLIGQFSLEAYGITDAEDPVYDPVTGNLLVLDGVKDRLFELTLSGDLVRFITLPSVVDEAEGLAYDPVRDVFYVGSGQTSGKIFEVDHQGTLLSTFDLLNGSDYRNPETGGKPKIKGLELAPSSDPGDGDHLNLYVADYGRDQFSDGRLFELDLYPDWQIA